MKRLLFVLLMSIIAAQARSQVIISLLLGDKLNSNKLEFGLDGGLNLADMKGLGESKSAPRFNLGFYFDIKLKDPAWMFHTGVMVKSTVGAQGLPVYSLDDADLDAAFAGGSIDRKLSYFYVPIMMKRQFKNNFFVEAGPMLGLLNGGSDVFRQKVKDKDDLTYKLKTKDRYHTLDAGMMAGIGYRLMGGNGMNLGVRYYYGLVDVEIDDSGPDLYNRSIYFYVGIPIGKGKSKAQE